MEDVEILSKYQCEFRKAFNSQQDLVSMIEKQKERVDKGGTFDTYDRPLYSLHRPLYSLAFYGQTVYIKNY